MTADPQGRVRARATVPRFEVGLNPSFAPRDDAEMAWSTVSDLARAVGDALLDHRYIVRVFSAPDEAQAPWKSPGAAVVDHPGRVSVYWVDSGQARDEGDRESRDRREQQMLEEYRMVLWAGGFVVSPVIEDALRRFDVTGRSA